MPGCSHGPLVGDPIPPVAYPRPKELRIGDEILEVWEDNLALKFHAILDQNNVDWSSTNIVRIGYVNDPSGNIILWIGIWCPNPGCGSTPLSYDIELCELNIRSPLDGSILTHIFGSWVV